MRTTIAAIATMLICFAALGDSILALAAAEKNKEADLAKARREAARKSFATHQTKFKDGISTDVESIYVWSHRWMEAEVDMLAGKKTEQLAAMKAHLDRMIELEKACKKMEKMGVGPSLGSSGEYYRLDAELRYTRAKIKHER